MRVVNLKTGVSYETDSYSQSFAKIEEECNIENCQFTADDLVINHSGNNELFVYTRLNDLVEGPTFVIV